MRIGVMADASTSVYCLVPEYRYPYGLEDCFSAYRWMVEQAGDLAIDIQKSTICGDSAGGALAASLTHMILDRNLPAPSLQMLIYPVLDVLQETDSMKRFVDTPIWNAKQNKKMWDLYTNTASNDAYASPA